MGCIRRTHEYLIEAQALYLIIPRVCPEEIEQGLTHVTKGSEVFSVHENEAGANLLCLRYEHELADAKSPGVIVASCQNVLLLHAKRLRLQFRAPVLEYLGVKAVIVLCRRCQLRKGERETAIAPTNCKRTRSSFRFGGLL